MKLMNAEVFAKELEKCRLLTTFLGQNVENLDDCGCPKIQDRVKTDSLWIFSSYPESTEMVGIFHKLKVSHKRKSCLIRLLQIPVCFFQKSIFHFFR